MGNVGFVVVALKVLWSILTFYSAPSDVYNFSIPAQLQYIGGVDVKRSPIKLSNHCALGNDLAAGWLQQNRGMYPALCTLLKVFCLK